jgi:Tannase and feruloyl esterase
MAVAHYPQDYDGIVLSVPILYFSVRDLSRELHQKMQMAPGAWIPPTKEHAIQMETVRLCDNLDGLADGVINNYVACNQRLDPKINPDPLANIRCPGGNDTGSDCLSEAQMKVINAFHTPIELGFPLANGETDIAPIPVSQESAGDTKATGLSFRERSPTVRRFLHPFWHSTSGTPKNTTC